MGIMIKQALVSKKARNQKALKKIALSANAEMLAWGGV